MALPEPEGAVPPEDRPGQGRGSEVPEPIRVFGLGEGPPQSVAANRAAILSGPLGRRPRDLQGFQAAQGRGQTWTATGAMSAPPPLQIREANAHLVAVHRRAVELEARLDAAERTVRSQAERLARHDEQLRAALDELGRAKDREIAALQEQLLTSEATVHSLQAAVQQRDKLIRQLQPRAELLQNICRQRPPLAGLLAALAEAERLGPLPASDSGHPFSGAPSLLLANSTEEEGNRDHLQPAVFGTTV